MPECFVRYSTLTGEIYETRFLQELNAPGQDEAAISVGERSIVPDPRLYRVDPVSHLLRDATAQEQQDWIDSRPETIRQNLIQALRARPANAPVTGAQFDQLLVILEIK